MPKLKRNLTARLKRTALYTRWKASIFHDLYWRVTGTRWIEARDREIAFYRGLLDGFRPHDLVFDVGANDGSKTDVFLRLGARVVAIEPDEVNQQLIRNKFLRFRLNPRPVTVVGKAASDRVATEEMWVDGPGSAVNTFSKKWAEALKSDQGRLQGGHNGLTFSESKLVSTTTIKQLIEAYGEPYYIKIDVEGYEPNVLLGLDRPVRFLSFEVNLPEFRLEGIECVRRLASLCAEGRFNYVRGGQEHLALEHWTEAGKFLTALERCTESSIDVFWKTPASANR